MIKAVHVIDDGLAATAVLHPPQLEILGALAEPEWAAGLARRIGNTAAASELPCPETRGAGTRQARRRTEGEKLH